MKIFDIQRFCVNDGKGIRTTVFFRDCPLRCKWCANPESWAELSSVEKSGFFKIRDMTVSEVLAEVLRDKAYYENSGGGVTLSGGEPLLHIDEVVELLQALKQAEIDVTVETCGNIPLENLKKAMPYVNEFYYDVKHVDEKKLRDFTRGDSKLIMENLKWLLEKGAGESVNVTVRTPVIPGFNDSEEELTAISETVKKLGGREPVLLPYHRLGKDKYTKLGLTYSEDFSYK